MFIYLNEPIDSTLNQQTWLGTGTFAVSFPVHCPHPLRASLGRQEVVITSLNIAL